MKSIASFIQGQSRPSSGGLLSWSRAAACVIVVGAVSASALAQAPSDTTAGEKTEPASEKAPTPDIASHPEPDAPAASNPRRKATSGVDAQVRRLAADLKLDAAQQAKIRPILVERSEQMQRLQQDRQLTPTERQKRALAIGDRSAEQIRAQLTEAQRAQYIQPRATTVAQVAPATRRGGMGAAPVTAPTKGATK